jgi:hypothetical protein
MEQKTSLAKSAIPYGIIFGVIMIIEFVIGYAMGIDPQKDPWVGILMSLLNYLVLPFTLIMMACNHFKNKLNGGYISFGQCIKSGVVVCVIAALVFSVVTAIVYMVSPEIKEDILEQQKIAMAQSPGMTSEQLKMGMSVAETMMEPYIMIPLSVLMYALVGLIISLIVGAIVKKDNPGAF